MKKTNNSRRDFVKNTSVLGLGIISTPKTFFINKGIENDDQIEFYKNKGCNERYIRCPKGSMVFWDSRTLHCGVEPRKGRENQNFRFRQAVLPAGSGAQGHGGLQGR